MIMLMMMMMMMMMKRMTMRMSMIMMMVMTISKHPGRLKPRTTPHRRGAEGLRADPNPEPHLARGGAGLQEIPNHGGGLEGYQPLGGPAEPGTLLGPLKSAYVHEYTHYILLWDL